MNLSEIFILRPVMTTLVSAALVIFGLISYFILPINDLPAVDFPTVSVSATLPGANAETVASALATPLERQFTTIAGIDNMSSVSSQGSCQVTLQFDLKRDIDGATQDVQAAIIAARSYLPTNLPTPPTVRKVNPADSPILFIALSSPTLPLYTVDEYAENLIASRVSMVSGVAQVQVMGSQVYAPHVQVDPRKLAAYGLGFDQVTAAIRSANVNLPTGTLFGPDTTYNIVANGQVSNAATLSPVIVSYRDGAAVRLQDIGRVIDSVQTDKVASWFNNTRAIILAVQRQPNTNTIKIVDDIRTLLPTFKSVMPGSVEVNVLYDRSQSIRRSVDDVKKTLLLTVGLVIAVIFLFLRNLSTTIIASVALPVSLIGTFAAMKLLGFTLNNISLMALTLCVGFVVDDAIVVLENVIRHIELGESPYTAAIKGSREIGFTIVSMTLSLVAVFIPILLMGGIVGRLFFEFGATMTVAILISGFVSLSLTPMLCSRFLRVKRHTDVDGKDNRGLFWFLEWGLLKLSSLYGVSLRHALHHKLYVIASFFLMLIATGYLLQVVPKGFLPSEDNGMIVGSTQAAEGISFEEMVVHQRKIAEVVSKNKNIARFMSSVGSGGQNSGVNQGRVFMVLKPQSERKLKIDEVVQELRRSTANIPGIRLFMQNQATIRIGGQQSKAQYQLTLSSANTTELYRVAATLEKNMRELAELQDVNSDLQIRNLQLDLKIDRDKCAQFGVSVQRVQDALNSAYSSRQVSVIYTPSNQYWVILEVLPEYYKDPTMLNWFFVRSDSGKLIPLLSLASYKMGAGPLQINHLGQFPSATLSFNLKPGVPLSDAVTRVKELAKKTVPSTIIYSFQGTAQAFEASMSNLGILLVVSIMVIYIVLGILYESFIHPLTILSGLPSAGLGALLILLLCHLELNIYSFLGLILLIGIVKKNAIMMVDFAVEKSRREVISSEDAIFEASITRFRPIMMTTMAALFGSLPIAIAMGEGAESRQPLGLTIVGGLLVSQVVTLYITPVFYVYTDRLQQWLIARRKQPLRKGEVT